MRADLHKAHRWMAAHRGVTLLVPAALVLVGLALYARSTTEQDVGAMLPDGPGSPREAARLLSDFGVVNTLLIDLELPGATEGQLAEQGRTLATGLRGSGAFLEVYTGPSAQEMLVVGQVLFPRRLYLFEDPAAEIERRLEPERIKASLARLRSQLSSPQALVMKADLLRDPLGLDAELLAGFSQLAGDVHPFQGQLLSRDGRHLLLVTTPVRSALDARASRALLDTVATQAARLAPGPAGPMVVTVVGGPRFAAESAAAVRKDVVITLLTSAVGLILLFVARFRSLRLLLLAAIPVGLGMVGGLTAVVLVQGEIHALTLAFGSVLMGVGMDYPLYLLNAASVHTGDPLERMRAGLEETWGSLWLGFLTTLIAFMMMLLSRFPFLKEGGLFAGAGIVTSFAATLVLLVPLCAVWGPKRWSGIPKWMPALQQRGIPPWLASGIAVVILAASVVLAPSLRFDGELRHLDAQRPRTLADFEQVMDRFGLHRAGSLVVARGRTAQEALALNDAVESVVRRSLAAGDTSGTLSVGSFLPAVATQRARAKRLAELDVSRARARLSAAAVETGFLPGAFDGFWAEVSAVQAGRVAPLTPEDFTQTSLEPLLKRMLRCSADTCIAVTSVQPREPAQVASLAGGLPTGAVLLNADALAKDTMSKIPRQLALLSGLGLALNVLLLALAYRSPRLAIAACLPGCLGLAGTIAILAACHVPLNIVSASALVLILGCGVDYGIFALQGLTGPSPVTGVESTGVLLTALTALTGFGTLVLASYRALQSLGAAVGLGIIISAGAAIFLLPGLYRVLRPRIVKVEARS
jgi:predicted exporter